MGRIKTQLIKRITKQVMALHGDEFTADYDKNQLLVGKYVSVSSKKLRNIIAGYATRLAQVRR